MSRKKKLAKENFKNYGIGLFEFIKFSMWKPEKTASLVKEVQGVENYRKILNHHETFKRKA